MFTAEIIEKPTWRFANKQASVSAIVTIKAGEVVIDTRPVSVSISIYTAGWKEKGYEVLIAKAKSEFDLYKLYYNKIVADTGFASPDEIMDDIQAKINTALAEV